MLLQLAGYAVDLATDIASATKFADRNKFDVLLCDLNLPDGNGLDLARELKTNEASRRVPIVAATASAMPPIKVDADHAGCDGFLAKPIPPSVLRSEVERQLRRARSRDAGGPEADAQ